MLWQTQATMSGINHHPSEKSPTCHHLQAMRARSCGLKVCPLWSEHAFNLGSLRPKNIDLDQMPDSVLWQLYWWQMTKKNWQSLLTAKLKGSRWIWEVCQNQSLFIGLMADWVTWRTGGRSQPIPSQIHFSRMEPFIHLDKEHKGSLGLGVSAAKIWTFCNKNGPSTFEYWCS
jgi:hypothetical protein